MEDSTTLNESYASLFKEEVMKNDITIQTVKRSKRRNDIAILNVDFRYTLILYGLSKENNVTKYPDVNYIQGSVKKSANILYRGIKTSSFQFDYATGVNDFKLDALNFYLNADSVTTFRKNDSTIYYSANMKTAAVSYEHEGVRDLYIESGRKSGDEIEVLFVTRNRQMFILLLFSNTRSLSLPKQKILSLLK